MHGPVNVVQFCQSLYIDNDATESGWVIAGCCMHVNMLTSNNPFAAIILLVSVPLRAATIKLHSRLNHATINKTLLTQLSKLMEYSCSLLWDNILCTPAICEVFT